MRILQLLLAVSIAALASCDQNNGQEQQQEQQATSANPPSTPSVPSQPIISTIQITMTIDCAGVGGGPPSVDSLAGIATTVTLGTSDGRQIRFETDAHSKPNLAAQPNGDFALTLVFTPENNGDLVGRTVSDMDAVNVLSFQFSKVLSNGLNLQVGQAGITSFIVAVNGVTVVNSALGAPSSATDENSPTQYDVSSYFNGFDQAYRNAGGT
jgi:hypothetical protein